MPWHFLVINIRTLNQNYVPQGLQLCMAWENSLAYSMRPEEFKLIAFAVNTFFSRGTTDTKPGVKFLRLTRLWRVLVLVNTPNPHLCDPGGSPEETFCGQAVSWILGPALSWSKFALASLPCMQLWQLTAAQLCPVGFWMASKWAQVAALLKVDM